MKQLTLATVGLERYAKTTRRAAFLAEMERVVQWSAICTLIEPFYPNPGNGRPPVRLERMLRLYFCNNGSIYRTQRSRRRCTIRRRCAASLGSTSAASRPDETT